MKTVDFKFFLPKELIAVYPSENRSKCRLLVLNSITGKITHHIFCDLIQQLIPGDLLVFNNTKVMKARLYGYSIYGKKVEILIERILNSYYAFAYIYTSDILQVGSSFIINEKLGINIYVCNIYTYGYNKLFKVYFSNVQNDILTVLNNFGHIPIPPYLKRCDEPIDYELYQTVYGEHFGSIASPTAGLHFDTILLNKLLDFGIKIAFVTLHIGSASFYPVRVSLIQNHIMHEEYIEVPQLTVDHILCCKKRKNRVIAVGTTVVKSLETASLYAKNNVIIESFSGYSKIFIYPGYHFRVVDALITNFHLSQSTLIMLVSAFAGYHNTFHAYYTAMKLKYKFLSYGDAMLIT